MFLNIITPCSRPENLQKISLSINIPKDSYRWLVVFDFNENDIDKNLIPCNAERFFHKNKNSVVGHDQRNRALREINFGHIYSNDDDTLIHPNLWENISYLDNYDIISFKQQNPDQSHRLRSEKLSLGYIDSHNFIYSAKLIKKLNINFDYTKYDADGIFAEQLFNSTTNSVFIDKYLSVYNKLNPQTQNYSDNLC